MRDVGISPEVITPSAITPGTTGLDGTTLDGTRPGYVGSGKKPDDESKVKGSEYGYVNVSGYKVGEIGGTHRGPIQRREGRGEGKVPKVRGLMPGVLSDPGRLVRVPTPGRLRPDWADWEIPVLRVP